MKNLATAFLVLALTFYAGTTLKAQQNKTLPGSFDIVNNEHPENESFYKNSILAANMEQYRLRDARVRLEFENGFALELYSAKELFVNNPSLSLGNYAASQGTNKMPVFGILPDGRLTAKVFTQSKK